MMCLWLFNVYMDGVVREVKDRLELLSANGDRFDINQLQFADDIALVADSAEKLCLVEYAKKECSEAK